MQLRPRDECTGFPGVYRPLKESVPVLSHMSQDLRMEELPTDDWGKKWLFMFDLIFCTFCDRIAIILVPLESPALLLFRTSKIYEKDLETASESWFENFEVENVPKCSENGQKVLKIMKIHWKSNGNTLDFDHFGTFSGHFGTFCNIFNFENFKSRFWSRL